MSLRPTISIVIPAYNEEENIIPCLQSCVDQEDGFEEIIVVNNKSTDNTATLVQDFAVKHPSVTLIEQNDLQGIAPTRNKGFKHVKSEIIARIDADAILMPGWVRATREVFTNPTVDAASGPVTYHDMPLQKASLKVDEKIRSTLNKMAKNHRFLFGTNMAIRRTAWDDIQDKVIPDPHDEHHEDISLALCLYQNSHEIVYSPEMIAGMSARRIEDKPSDFYKYIMRFERTFKAYNLKSAVARIPILIYLLIYFPLRTIRKFYNVETRKFTTSKLKAHD